MGLVDEKPRHAASVMSPMTPLAFLDRAEAMFGDRVAILDDGRSITYAAMAERVGRAASVLREAGIGTGDVVAVLAPNTTMMLESHYSVPHAGAVLLTLNVRLSPGELARIVAHAGARLLLHDDELAGVAHAIPGLDRISASELERRMVGADRLLAAPVDEQALLSLNYTSGTTGRPKGVMYHHRGAYLQALAMAYHSQLGPGDIHLWTLPMFHCNGWCFTWAVTAAGATHLCLRRVEAGAIWRRIDDHAVTSLNAAPTVLTMLAWDDAAHPLTRPVRIGTGGAPPSPSLLERMEALNFGVSHLYGLTETLGPIIACQWQPEWDALPLAERARLLARQGNANIAGASVRVLDGEVQVRGNTIMLGYYRDPAATAEAFTADGWLRTGDIGVLHEDGYLELRDRAADVIISGGENIASIEVEQAIASHPAVLEVAVVSMPDERWGEVPLAHVTLRPGAEASADEVIAHVKDRLARFKAPKRVVFGPLPKTSTGKVQKFLLRDQAWEGRGRRVG
ncbi:MAG: AMP-binding protein [Solirubrobacteraceae bacterium]